MESSIQSKASLREKAADEFREFVIIATYLYVCFAALYYLKAAILHTHGIAFEPLGLGAIKAAICAKFMLFGRALHIGDRFSRHPLIVPTLYRSFAFGALLIILNIIEEIVVGAIHGRTLLDSLGEIADGSFRQLIAATFVLLLILIPYFAFRSLADVIGDKTLVRLYFERRGSIDRA